MPSIKTEDADEPVVVSDSSAIKKAPFSMTESDLRELMVLAIDRLPAIHPIVQRHLDRMQNNNLSGLANDFDKIRCEVYGCVSEPCYSDPQAIGKSIKTFFEKLMNVASQGTSYGTRYSAVEWFLRMLNLLVFTSDPHSTRKEIWSHTDGSCLKLVMLVCRFKADERDRMLRDHNYMIPLKLNLITANSRDLPELLREVEPTVSVIKSWKL
ncbi:hypothetical protein QBC41DRAFT_388665 [Cercophora samala]|uniref:Uncharacterized protein n=1 Tax=Cercophora samala TaxID=330535 RepID=A0AA39ZGF8_9PEZI|nr:hypothetical protein QBC41DRAFT_388665 [Cercophora samala]